LRWILKKNQEKIRFAEKDADVELIVDSYMEMGAYFEGTHKKLAFKQALIGALAWSLILYGIMYFIGLFL